MVKHHTAFFWENIFKKQAYRKTSLQQSDQQDFLKMFKPIFHTVMWKNASYTS